jgi:ubiquitin-like 1-activating enzyme E1 B
LDETENLSKKLSELGIERDSFLQVIDEDEENPRVNLLISLHETDDLEKPVKPADDAFSGEQIPRKPEKKPSEIGTNGFGSHKEAASNGLIGHPVLEPASAKRKADDNELVELPAKKARAGPTADSEVITIDDADGSILIE